MKKDIFERRFIDLPPSYGSPFTNSMVQVDSNAVPFDKGESPRAMVKFYLLLLAAAVIFVSPRFPLLTTSTC